MNIEQLAKIIWAAHENYFERSSCFNDVKNNYISAIKNI